VPALTITTEARRAFESQGTATQELERHLHALDDELKQTKERMAVFERVANEQGQLLKDLAQRESLLTVKELTESSERIAEREQKEQDLDWEETQKDEQAWKEQKLAEQPKLSKEEWEELVDTERRSFTQAIEVLRIRQ
jgi:predicted HNH restriction endonuclease